MSDGSKYSNMLEDSESQNKESFSSAKYNNSSYSGGGDNPCEGVIDTSSYVPLSILGAFCFISFILGCVATSTANDNSDRLDKLESKVKRTAPPNHCEKGDVLLGAKVIEATNEGTKNWYAILGEHG